MYQRIRFIIILLGLSISNCVLAQQGNWTGFITQDGVRYEMTVNFEKQGGEITGTTRVFVQDSIYGGEIFGKIHGDRSMNLWDHEESPQIFPDELPSTMRRRYQMIYRRSIAGDTIKGYWQQVHKGLDDPYRKGWIELRRAKKGPKA